MTTLIADQPAGPAGKSPLPYRLAPGDRLTLTRPPGRHDFAHGRDTGDVTRHGTDFILADACCDGVHLLDTQGRSRRTLELGYVPEAVAMDGDTLLSVDPDAPQEVKKHHLHDGSSAGGSIDLAGLDLAAVALHSTWHVGRTGFAWPRGGADHSMTVGGCCVVEGEAWSPDKVRTASRHATTMTTRTLPGDRRGFTGDTVAINALATMFRGATRRDFDHVTSLMVPQ